MSGKTYIEKRKLLKTLNQSAIIPVKVKGNEDDSSFSELEDGYILLENFPTAITSLETIVPTVTGGGSVNNFSVMFTKQGNTVTANGFTRVFNVADTETTTTVALPIPTAYAPAANFTGGFQVYGGANSTQLNSAAGDLRSIGLSSVTGTKNIQIALTLQAAASGDFETAVSFYASWQVAV